MWRINRPLAATWIVLSAIGPLLPTVLAIAVGVVVGQIPGVVHRGFGSPAGHRIAHAAFAMAVIMVLGDVIDMTRWRCSDLLGIRLRADQHQRIVAAMLGPAGVAHADDPEVQDAVAGADSVWLRSLPDGVMNVAGTRMGGYGGAVLLARYEPVAAVALTVAWVIAGRWKWRRAAEDAKANLGEIRDMRRSAATAELAMSARAAKEVRLFGLGEWLGARFAREWRHAMAEIWRRRHGGFGEGAAVIGVLAAAHVVSLVVLAHAAASGHLSLTGLTIALQGVLATRGIGAVPYGFHQLQYGLSAVPEMERLDALVRAVPDLPGDAPAPTLRTAIRLDDVRFRYPRAGSEVLSGVSFDIPYGCSTAIVGENGAGKSTLIQLLCRLRDPTGGHITVDDVDLATVDPTSWQQAVASVSQQALRLPLSVEENLSGSRHVDEKVLHDAVEAAQARDIVAGLPQGWATTLSREFDGGGELSGGQWQRLALARALAALWSGAQLLVLDEPSAHLDVRAEADLYNRFLELTRGRTSILVSHRFSTVRRAEHIVVIEAGQVVEEGTHDSLISAGGRYARLFGLQASRFADPDQDEVVA